MEDLEWGDIVSIGITENNLYVVIKFYNPVQQGGDEYSEIFLTLEQVSKIIKLGGILNGKTS